jgi:hypothetical protein
MRRWFMWIPVLMVASLLFWTVALALGGMSLMAANKISLFESHCLIGAASDVSSEVDGAGSRNGYDPIVVHIEESGEPEDVNDNPSAGPSAATADDEPAGESASQPGKTAF